jgi:hypothetical protein
MTLDSVICWRWTPSALYRSKFGPETVNTLRKMVARHYPHPHRFACVTNDPAGLDPEVVVIPDFGDFVDLKSPHADQDRGLVKRYPSCYRRLRIFHPGAAQWFGQRFVSLDLDMVIVGDLSPVWNRPEDFVIWGDTNPTTLYNGSMVMLTAGARSKVWTDFDPASSPARARASGQFGSDQGWISHCLGRGEAKWGQKDGVYSYRNDIRPRGNRLPDNARMVIMHGEFDPWEAKPGWSPKTVPWIRENYR